jgi:C1A family cysteine protease
METHHFIKTGELLSLSEQQFVDCLHDDCDQGCHGGCKIYALNYAKLNPVMLESDYLYRGYEEACQYNPALGKVAVVDVFQGPANSESGMMAAIVQGPISVNCNADNTIFRQYVGGVLNNKDCPTSLTHALNAVGYGTTDDGQKYWIIRNSFGVFWGEDGYIRMERTGDGDPGICGIQEVNLYASTN